MKKMQGKGKGSRWSSHLIVDAVISLKVPNLPWEYMDMHMLEHKHMTIGLLFAACCCCFFWRIIERGSALHLGMLRQNHVTRGGFQRQCSLECRVALLSCHKSLEAWSQNTIHQASYILSCRDSLFLCCTIFNWLSVPLKSPAHVHTGTYNLMDVAKCKKG